MTSTAFPSSAGRVREGDQAGQAGPAFHEPTLAGPDPLVVLHMAGEIRMNRSIIFPGTEVVLTGL